MDHDAMASSVDASAKEWANTPEDWEDFMWGRESAPFLDFELPLDTVGARGQQHLRMHQNLQGSRETELGTADGLHTTVWEAAIALHLMVLREERRTPGRWKGLRVLELGAGTGLVGLTLAACGAEVVLTELAEALPLLEFNVEANRAALAAHQRHEEEASPSSSSSSGTRSSSEGGDSPCVDASFTSAAPAANSAASASPFPLVATLEWGLPLSGDVCQLLHGPSTSSSSFSSSSSLSPPLPPLQPPAPASSPRPPTESSDSQRQGSGAPSPGLSPPLPPPPPPRPFDVVVGADVVYSEALAQPLLHAIDQVCTRGVTELWLCRLRRGGAAGAEKARAFYAALNGDSGGDGSGDGTSNGGTRGGLGFSRVETVLVGGPRTRRPAEKGPMPRRAEGEGGPVAVDSNSVTAATEDPKQGNGCDGQAWGCSGSPGRATAFEPQGKGGACGVRGGPDQEQPTEPHDPGLSELFYRLSDQALPFEIVRAS